MAVAAGIEVVALTHDELVAVLVKQGERFAQYRSKAPVGQQGRWTIDRFEVRVDLQNLRMMVMGRGCSPGTFTRLVRDERTIVMSDTDAEVNDFLPFVRAARGKVLVSGLGLGCVTQALLAKENVEHVTVIEIDADVIALTAPHLACDRLTVINADAREWKPARGQKFSCGWHDIWDTISGDNLPEMQAMKQKYRRRCQWQMGWAEREVLWLTR